MTKALPRWYPIALLLFLTVAVGQNDPLHAAPPRALPAGHDTAAPIPTRPHYAVAIPPAAYYSKSMMPQYPARPKYLLLETDHSAVGQPVRAGSYAYGWFGASPRSHYGEHRGYYGDRWIWRGQIAP